MPPLWANLSWVQFIVLNLLNKMLLPSLLPVDLNWWGDASSLFSIGVMLGTYWAVWKWAPGFLVGPCGVYDIGWAEAVTVELGLCVTISHHFLSSGPVGGQTFLVHSDNAGIVFVTNKGHSRSQETNQILKHVYLLQARHQIHIKTIHVMSQNNISDALSWGAIEEFLSNFPSINSQISIPLPDHLMDKLVSL